MADVECPHCYAGNVARVRPETGEIVHDFVQIISPTSRRLSQTLCWKDPRSPAMKARAVTAPESYEG